VVLDPAYEVGPEIDIELLPRGHRLTIEY
jgi:hypothetical protein